MTVVLSVGLQMEGFRMMYVNSFYLFNYIQEPTPVTKRDHCINELYETEKNYIDVLDMLIQVCGMAYLVVLMRLGITFLLIAKSI